jgi:hypothetical protein
MPKRLPDLRRIPAVDTILQRIDPRELPRPLVVAVVREVLAGIRKSGSVPEEAVVISRIQAALTGL